MKTKSWFVTIVLLLAFCSYLFYYFYTEERARAIDVVVSHQRVYARQAAYSLNELVDKWNNVLSYLSQDPNIIDMNDAGRDELTKLRGALHDEIKSITRVDERGVILATSPLFPGSVGADISKQRHIAKILADHKPVVSDVFDAVQGFQAIAIHYPVFKGGRFDGTIALVIDFGKVGKRILGDVESDGSGYAWMLSSDGIELYCPITRHIGKSVHETSKDSPDLEDVAQRMLSGREGVATLSYSEAVGRIAAGKRIVYYLPVHINDTIWPLAVVYSEDEITKHLADFSRKLAAILGLVFLGGMFMSYFGIKGWIVVAESEARKKAEEQLRESEERYRNLYANAAIGICRVTPNGKMLFANPHLVRMLGFESFEQLAASKIEGPGLALGMLGGNQEARGLESKWKKSDGSEIFVRQNVWLMYAEDGSVAYYDITAEDITEQKLLEAQLLQAQKMEAIGQLAGGVAHDFNNMIGVILGYASLIEKDLDPASPVVKRIQSVIQAAQRSANLAKQLLGFARKQVITPIAVNFNTEILSIDKMLGRLLGENISIRLLLGEKLWNIKMDPSQIDQVVTNLCTNARDAIQNVGTITLQTSNVSVEEVRVLKHGTVPKGDYVLFTCTDTGHGIDPRTIDRIFEPFFSTKAKGKGTGLGLATVFGIIKQNNGCIDVTSEEGKGTTFSIYLPRYDGEVEPREEPAAEPLVRGKETILVVEDESELLDLINSTLESNGYTAFCTTSPLKALTICEEHKGRIHLLLTDVIMPEMNGKELQEQLLKVSPGMKTLFISGYTANIVAEHGVLEKETQFLQKPFTPESLLRKIRSVLSES
ncbi:MAG TPA: ATP-binding protein [Bacteroidota bacterium]|nr:ATP-binding protein [Bacteroidota bacterium]